MLVTVLVVVGLSMACAGGTTLTPTPTYPAYTPTPVDTPIPTPTAVVDGEPPIDRTWISPGKVQIGNFYPGARAEWPITIHNGNDYTATFAVAYRYPDRVAEGHAWPTPEVKDWVIIADATPVFAAYQTREILVVLNMPYGTKAPGSKWEFWISVQDKGQGGMVVTETCSRWQITMR